MFKTGGEHGVAFFLLLVGGHVVAGEMLHGRAGAAVYAALAVAACVLIFVAAEALLDFWRKKGGG